MIRYTQQKEGIATVQLNCKNFSGYTFKSDANVNGDVLKLGKEIK